MASEYTQNYNFDLYTDNDKPNLRDQYNGAITKIDAQLHEFSNNLVVVTEAANQAKDKANENATEIADEVTRAKAAEQANAKAVSDEVTRAKAAEQANADAIQMERDRAEIAEAEINGAIRNIITSSEQELAKLKGGAYLDTTPTVVDSATLIPTSKAVHDALSNINTSIGDGSITTQKIADGAVTAAKIAQSAKDAIMGGMTIKIFGNKIPGTDNTGASYPTGCEMAGAYIPALDILIIWKIHIVANSGWNSTNPLVLPSYVPSMHTMPTADAQTGIGGISWTSDNYFKSWYGVIIEGRKVYVSQTINDNFDSVPIVMSCAPFRDGDTNSLTS